MELCIGHKWFSFVIEVSCAVASVQRQVRFIEASGGTTGVMSDIKERCHKNFKQV
jgi:hypothetical protein